MASTYSGLYLDARRKLMANGVSSAQLEAREIVCYAAGKSREDFFRDMALYVSSETERRVAALMERSLAGEPVAYLIGEWSFYGLTLDITPDVLIPRADTEVLAEQAILAARDAGTGARVLDLCAGSGCVGLAVAANAPDCKVALAELSEVALRVCRRNVRRCGFGQDRVVLLAVDAKLPPLPNLWDFDVIACNPPYIPTGEISALDASVRDYEPHLALDGGEDGLTFYRNIAAKWKAVLKPGGRLLFEVGLDQASAVTDILSACGFTSVRAVPDTRDIPRVVMGTAP